MLPTCDVADAHPLAQVCELQMRDFGMRLQFQGSVRTIRCYEDNALIRQVLSAPSQGEVLVVDGGGSLGRALMGDMLASLAAANGWAGVVISGVVRDSAALSAIDIGIKALGTSPRRSEKAGQGSIDIAVHFGGIVFHPGDQLFADEDGIVLIPAG